MAVNVSNPTSAAGRVSVGEALKGRAQFLRQNLTFLKEIASTPGARTPLSAHPDPDSGTVRAMRDIYMAHADLLKTKTIVDHEWPLPKHPDQATPLCTLRYKGLLLRPVGEKAKGNSVSSSRTFGGAKLPLSEIRALLVGLGPEVVSQALKTKIFTRGTVEGFEARLKLLTGKTVKSIYRSPGFPEGHGARMALLERLLPMDVELLPDWHGGEGGDLVEMLKQNVAITAKSSAGAPYWRPKGDVMPEVFHVLEMVVKHLKDGSLDELLRQQPELFLIECKNKEDRYDLDKLETKTRPYFNPPAHWNLLASFLHQAASHALYKVGSGKRTWNAYGWSAAHGGITRLVEEVKMRYREGQRGWGYVYGDDGDIYFVAKGTLYRVSPDVKQMDSCVDFDTLRLTYDYILHSFSRRYGPNTFWANVARALLALLETPRIVVSGTQLYTKQSDGLMSGVVGTTLFDTVKSAVAYSSLLENHDHNPSLLLNEEHVTRWMLENHGLVIKPGTWEPESMDLDVEPCGVARDGTLVGPERALYGSGKFLGIQYVHVAGPKHSEWIPYLPDEDWASAILAPRDSTLGEKVSNTCLERLAFDRIRGYLVTGAIFSSRVRNALLYWVDKIPGEVILMQPQGTTPPEGILFGEEGEKWEYPTPEFVPSMKWVWDIYATPGNEYGEAPTPIFRPDVLEQVSELRAEDRRIRISVKNGETKIEAYAPKEVELPEILPQALKPEKPELKTAWRGAVPARAVDPVQRVALPGTGAPPRDLAKPEQTDEQAVLYDLQRRPKERLLDQLVDEADLKPLSSYAGAVDGVKVQIPPSMIAREQPNPVVHPPTKRGLLPPVTTPRVAPVVVTVDLPEFAFVKALPALPGEAVGHILNASGLAVKYEAKPSYVFVGEPRQSVAVVTTTVYLGALGGVGIPHAQVTKPSYWKVAMVIKARSKEEAKMTFWSEVLRRNKDRFSEVVKQREKKDWSFSADRERVPYSEVDGPAPTPAAHNPLDPVPALVENRAGYVEVVSTRDSIPKVPAVQEQPVAVEAVPTVVSRAPYVIYDGPILPPRGLPVPKPRSPVPKRWWDTSSDDEDALRGYENAIYDWKTRRFIPIPAAGSGSSPPPVDRSTKRGVRRREKERASSSSGVSTHSGSQSSLEVVLEPYEPPKPEKPKFEKMPPEPEGGWPEYLMVKAKYVKHSEWPLRKAFTDRYGRLPPGKRTVRGAEKTEKGESRGVTHSAQGAGGPLPSLPDLSHIPLSVLKSIVATRQNGSKKKQEGQSTRRKGRGAGQSSSPQSSSSEAQERRSPDLNRSDHKRSARKGDKGAGN